MKKTILLLLLSAAVTAFAQAPDWYDNDQRRTLYPDGKYFIGFAEGSPQGNESIETATQRLKDAARVEALSTIRVRVQNTTVNQALSQTLTTMQGTFRQSTRDFSSTTKTTVQMEIPGLQVDTWTNPQTGTIAAFAYVKKATLIRLLEKKITVALVKLETALDQVDQLIASGQKQQARELAENTLPQFYEIDEAQKTLAAVDENADEESLQLNETRALQKRFTGIAIDKVKVAVYVTAPREVSQTVKQVVGGELVAGIVANSEYSAVERTAEFLAQIAREQNYQRSGNVDDEQIQALGKQFGVQLVCVATIMPADDDCYIQARLLDVEKATVLATARELSSLASLDQLVASSEILADKLVGKRAKQVVYTQEYSTILAASTSDCGIMSIDNTGSAAVVECKYLAKWRATIHISANAFIRDRATGKEYRLTGTNGISTTGKTFVTQLLTPFTLYFEKLPADVTNIDLIDPEKKGWRWENITLRPYGKADYFVFKDDIEPQYQAILRNQAEGF